MAYKRREQETEAWRVNDEERRRVRGEVMGEGVEVHMERNWWDNSGFDGSTMSPVVEEMAFDLEERGRPQMSPKGESWILGSRCESVRQENG